MKTLSSLLVIWQRESDKMWSFIIGFCMLVLIAPSIQAQDQWFLFDTDQSPKPVVVTFNTGTTTAMAFTSQEDGYTFRHGLISDRWYGNGLAWWPAVEATRDFIESVNPDVVAFQEVFHSDECANIPSWARRDFVCDEEWKEGGHTVARTVLGVGFQIACHPDRSDKCVGVNTAFGHFDYEKCPPGYLLCLDGLDRTDPGTCGNGTRVAKGVIHLVDDQGIANQGSITLVSIHGTSGISDKDIECRIEQFEQVFADYPGNEGQLVPEPHWGTLVMGDLNVDVVDPYNFESSATFFNNLLDVNGFDYVDKAWYNNPPPTYLLGNTTLDYVVSDTFHGICRVPSITNEYPFFDAAYFDHNPVVCDLNHE